MKLNLNKWFKVYLQKITFLKVFSRTKEEEIEYLKEALKTTKSDLERERQLNAAIKEKRVRKRVKYSNIFKTALDVL